MGGDGAEYHSHDYLFIWKWRHPNTNILGKYPFLAPWIVFRVISLDYLVRHWVFGLHVGRFVVSKDTTEGHLFQ